MAGREAGTLDIIRNLTYVCDRCGDLVHEINNLGQWQCRITLQNTNNGDRYSVAADHGPVRKQPKLYVPLSMIDRIPPITNRKVLDVSTGKNPDGTANPNDVYIVIKRYQQDTDQFTDMFLRI